MTVSGTDTTCKTIKDNDMDAPSGVYKITPCQTCEPMEVYCEMGLDGGGYTFLNSKDLAHLTNANLQTMFTDTTTFLLRLKKCDGDQPYIVLKQLSQYADTPLKLGLNQNTGYADPQNAMPLGNPYLYFGFLPISLANNGNTQGLSANDHEETFTNCDSNPNSYFALFANYKEVKPTNYSLTSDFPSVNHLLDEALPNPSTRLMPEEYFFFMETHFGGCGWYTQTDSRLRSTSRCIGSAAIGFR
jgi:hypothetical protein